MNVNNMKHLLFVLSILSNEKKGNGKTWGSKSDVYYELSLLDNLHSSSILFEVAWWLSDQVNYNF